MTPLIVFMVLVFESDGMPATGLEPGTVETLPEPILTAIAIASYFLLFLMWSVLMHAYVRFPMMRHFASSLTIINLGELANVSQRPRDEFGEAEGFAEALDVGAAI